MHVFRRCLKYSKVLIRIFFGRLTDRTFINPLCCFLGGIDVVLLPSIVYSGLQLARESVQSEGADKDRLYDDGGCIAAARKWV